MLLGRSRARGLAGTEHGADTRVSVAAAKKEGGVRRLQGEINRRKEETRADRTCTAARARRCDDAGGARGVIRFLLGLFERSLCSPTVSVSYLAHSFSPGMNVNVEEKTRFPESPRYAKRSASPRFTSTTSSIAIRRV